MDHVNRRKSSFKSIEKIAAKFANHTMVPLSISGAKRFLGIAQDAWKSLEDSHRLVLDACSSEDATNLQLAAFEPMMDRYLQLELDATDIIHSLTAAAAAAGGGPGAATPATANIRLPAMDMPKFDGTIDEWRAFKDLFLATIGNNTQLTGAQKLQYLKSSLHGKAADQISTLSTTDAHYTEAWTILTGKYENTREITQSLIRKMLEYRVVKTENAAELQALLDNFLKCIRSLRVLGRPVKEWDDLLIVILVTKLDPSTRREWAIRQTGTDLPTLKKLEEFLQGHIRGLLALGGNIQREQQSSSRQVRFEKNVRVHHASADEPSCPVCSKSHSIYSCKEFQAKSPTERSNLAKKLRICFNCLSSNHSFKECPSSGTCRQCGYRHHTLLHVPRSNGTPPINGINSTNNSRPTSSKSTNGEQKSREGQSTTLGSHHVSADENGVLMTAVVTVKDRNGHPHSCRIFIDPGSQADFMTEECVRRLGLSRRSCNIGVGGIGGVSAGRSKGKVSVRLISNQNENSYLDVQLLILEKLTDYLPSVRCESKYWSHFQGLNLADPQWYDPAPVDVLLGVKYYPYIKLYNKIMGKSLAEPTAWETIFGWAVSGACPVQKNTVTSFHISIELVDTFLRKFWETEEPPRAKILTAEEKKCEHHFLSTYKRDGEGRFIVQIPFNKKKEDLGASRMIAVNRFRQVERRLNRNPELKRQYTEFMHEYMELGHMSRVPLAEVHMQPNLYLCHHGVVNESSKTTKLRVVFDGSAVTSSGVSLNDAMYVGATLQDDLFDLLLRFRKHKVVIKGDIAKMFRQFRLSPEDADYHRIVWRDVSTAPLEDFRLETVTYGTACAPNLATRCLQQLAKDVAEMYPLASQALMNDAYVDDVLSGGESPHEVVSLYKELSAAVATAGMQLRKWISNSPDVLAEIPEEDCETGPQEFTDENMVKTLGVQWRPVQDCFGFKGVEFLHDGTVTKRKLYSDLARVFDPLGFVSCVTVRGKLLLQQLWSLSVDWDEEVPNNIQQLWEEYKDDLKKMSSILIPRQIRISPSRNELHCFSDSSEKALGTIIYVRSFFEDGTINISFVTSKTRVAPLKQVSLPRLELNAAKLGAELATHVKDVLGIPVDMFMWSDSTITLTWIAGRPRRWKTYIANRVAAIQEMVPVNCWRHVPGTDNPADLASRGMTAEDLNHTDFWWRGPEWLAFPELPTFQVPAVQPEVDNEEKHVTIHAAVIQNEWISRHSSFRKLRRIAAYIIRFLSRCKNTGLQIQVPPKGPLSEETSVLTPEELEEGMRFLIICTQKQYFSQDIAQLTSSNKVNPSSKLKSLYPFIDKHRILRMSGRLQKGPHPSSKKQLVVLPGDSHLVKVMILDYHIQNHHAGFQYTWSQLGMEYWILKGRDRVRHLLRSCVVCRRHRAKAAEQLMGQLPECRITPSRAFLHTGVDYAGPFPVKALAGRGWRTSKGWMCLFVCMASKAIHLELVDSLSTEAFLAALRRFVSRRGIPSHIYSDCGTNFVGAEKELKAYLILDETNETVSRCLSEQGIAWHFLPPGSPHQGGLWEAGVKSAKFQIRRVVGNLTLTKDQFVTLICEVEAILNSRPLYQKSSDPTDLEALTPGHLLTGEALTTVPSPSLLHIPQNRLSQYQLVVNRVQEFWRRWSKEYLNTLQQRSKWRWEKENVRRGDLVLLVEESAPSTWKMGRVEELHAGDDGFVRTVTVRTAKNSFKRPIVKLIPLVSQE